MLKIEPNKPPCIAYLDATINAFKKAVNIGAVDEGNVIAKRIGKHIYIIYNESGIFSGLQGNRKVNDDIISGVFYVVAVDDNNCPKSLSAEEIEKYTLRFFEPEYYDDTEVFISNLDMFFDSLLKPES